MLDISKQSRARVQRSLMLVLILVTLVSLVLYTFFCGHQSLKSATQQTVTSSLPVVPMQSHSGKKVHNLLTVSEQSQSVQTVYDFPSESEQPQSVHESSAVDKQQVHEEGDVKCVHPPLDPFAPSIMQYYESHPPVNCSFAMEDWVYVINGTFHISREAIRRYGNITCTYSPVSRMNDYSVRYKRPVRSMLDGTPLQSDFFRVFCVSDGGKRYTNIHAAVARNTKVTRRLQRYHSWTKYRNPATQQNTRMNKGRVKQSASFLNLSIFMLGFDSMSRMAWYRSLPKTQKYFTQSLGAIELEDYNIMGEGTAAALLPMLTGEKKEELPEARPGFPGAKPVGNYPWIWKELSKHGYVTAFAQDKPGIGAFNFNMLGFARQPTDHYMRTFYLAVGKERLNNNDHLCWGSTPRHTNFMNWFGSLLNMYRDFPKFLFGHYLEMSHGQTNRIQIIDDDLVAFVRKLEDRGHLNSTLLILLGDHGPKFHHYRHTKQGILEGRLPYFALRFPPWFQKSYPNIIKTLKTNARRLTTPLDVHATFKDILHYSGQDKGDIRNRAISLFKEIPKERTCTHAGIPPHWCACLEWEPLKSSDPLVSEAADTAIKTINSFTASERSRCAELTLQDITNSVRYTPSSSDLAAQLQWLKFKGSRTPPSNATVLYRVSFKTLPGAGHFEVTCDFDLGSNTFSVKQNQISRINKYGSQPDCLKQSKPHLRPFCYCDPLQPEEELKENSVTTS